MFQNKKLGGQKPYEEAVGKQTRRNAPCLSVGEGSSHSYKKQCPMCLVLSGQCTCGHVAGSNSQVSFLEFWSFIVT